MPDPVMQLVEQHNRLRRLFKQVPRLGGHQSAETRAMAICDLISIHSTLEEELIYPAMEALDPAMAQEAEAAHEEASALVEGIRAQNYADNGEVKKDLAELERSVESHARWEEDTFFPRLSQLPTEDLDRLGRGVYERQQELLREYPQALETSAETEGFIAAPRI
jgi:hemerythrin superfamily protein